MTAGYEYSPGSRSSTSAASQLLPSRDSATFNGDRPSRVDEDARLDGVDFGSLARRVGPRNRPCAARIDAALEVNPPRARAVRRFGTAATHDRSIRQPHRLVLDRAEDAIGQPSRVAPRAARVARRANHPPPALRTGTDCVEQPQLAGGHLEQHRLPAR